MTFENVNLELKNIIISKFHKENGQGCGGSHAALQVQHGRERAKTSNH